MVKSIEFKAPNLESILFNGLAFKKQDLLFNSQSSLPVEEVHRKIGVKKNSKVLFIAGGAGWWAGKLAEKTKLTFTDISKKQVDLAAKKKIGVNQFTINALRVPLKEKQYDWTVSFEPLPLKGNALPLVMLRGLLNEKGVKIISKYFSSGEKETAQKLKEIYGANIRTSEVKIKSAPLIPIKSLFGNIPLTLNSKPSTEVRLEPHVIVTVTSNEKVRAMVNQDLKLLAIINKIKPRGVSNIKLNNLKQEAFKSGIDGKKLVESLKRIDNFSKLFTPKSYLETFVKIN